MSDHCCSVLLRGATARLREQHWSSCCLLAQELPREDESVCTHVVACLYNGEQYIGEQRDSCVWNQVGAAGSYAGAWFVPSINDGPS